MNPSIIKKNGYKVVITLLLKNWSLVQWHWLHEVLSTSNSSISSYGDQCPKHCCRRLPLGTIVSVLSRVPTATRISFTHSTCITHTHTHTRRDRCRHLSEHSRQYLLLHNAKSFSAFKTSELTLKKKVSLTNAIWKLVKKWLNSLLKNTLTY